MKHSFTRLSAAMTFALLPGAVLAAEVFDSPGPGYRQQKARFSDSTERSVQVHIFQVALPNIRIAGSPASFLDQTSESPFSKPITLFPQPDKTAETSAAPAPSGRQQAK